MNKHSLEDVIRQNVYFPSNPNPKGWYPCVHPVCDHGRKGPRAAFKFSDDTVAFHCFNCSTTIVYDPSSGGSIPKKMKQILADFNIPEEEWQQVELNNLGNKKSTTRHSDFVNINPKILEKPKEFYYLADADEDDKWAQVAKLYLEHERGIDPDSYPFMLSIKSKNIRYKKWHKRLIIPIYKDNNLIYWQGRALSSQTKKYESPPYPKDCVLFGFDQLFENPEKPLYVVEGWFDAFPINGVALLGNELSEAQIKWLNKSRRQKVYIPDRFGDGIKNAHRALKQGWSISAPMDLRQCKDVNEAVVRYGKQFVLAAIKEYTSTSTMDGKIKLSQYCK